MDVDAPATVEAPHAASGASVAAGLGVAPDRGLDNREAHRRLARHGPNLLRAPKPESVWKILAAQFQSVMVWLLAGAATVSATFGQTTEALAIAVVLTLNAAIGFVTELKAVRSLESLRKLGQHEASVRRQGQPLRISTDRIVPGDIVLLDAGEQVAADLRILSANSLTCDESLLTGESLPVPKHSEPVAREQPVAERGSIAFKGTLVTRGSGEGVAIATGMATELGRISKLVEEAESGRSPLERRLAKLSSQLVWVTLLLTAAIVLVGVVGGRDWLLMLETGIALAVAAVPEGLPVVATLALARGLWRMARRNALVERLSAVETLGATTVICVDKTGTLTENRMTVTHLALTDRVIEVDGRDFACGEDPVLRQAIEAMALCSNASLPQLTGDAVAGPGSDQGQVGDPMEIGLLRAARSAGVERPALLQRLPEVCEVAFREDVKMMATLHRDGERLRIVVKGAPEEVLAAAVAVRGPDGPCPLDAEDRARWLARNRDLASQGLRVIALAERHADRDPEQIYAHLVLLGLVGMIDPVRADVPAAVTDCRTAGIRLVMLTGDQLATARAIADHLGFDPSVEAFEGRRLREAVEDETMQGALLRAQVFARVSPEEKLDLIRLYQNAGEVVAMTGDGVNDAPALRQADIGIAMGRRGSEVAREAAEIVLLDDAFPSITAAVRHGRIIFDNLRKFAVYLLSCNLSEILLVSLATLSGLPLPLLPLQILYLNLVTDVFPALALGLCEGGGEVMRRPPRSPTTPLLGRPQWLAVVGHGGTITFTTLGAFSFALLILELPYQEALTASFVTLSLAQIWHVFDLREVGDHPLDNEVTRNPWVWGAVLLCVALVVAGVSFAPLADLLKLSPPSAPTVWLALAASLVPVLIGQLALLWLDRQAKPEDF